MSKCNLCPRNCNVDRSMAGPDCSAATTGTGRNAVAAGVDRNATASERRKPSGFCGAPEQLKIARAGLHFYEEPFLSGNRGSGAVFFSNCNLRCVYCQNSQITQGDCFGIKVTVARLAEIFGELEAQGAHNINLVTGTPYIPQIAEALTLARPGIPVIWNTSGYDKVSSLEMLKGLVDIWLPDFKTMSPELGIRYMKAPDYPEVAMAALGWMVENSTEEFEEFVPYVQAEGCARSDIAGSAIKNDDNRNAGSADTFARGKSGCEALTLEAVYDDETLAETGIMKSGICVRHLVIPGQISDSMEVLKTLARFKDRIWISVMSQYTPMRKDFEFQELNRKLTASEYDAVVDAAEELGLERCMIQMEGAAEESFIPAFDGTGVL